MCYFRENYNKKVEEKMSKAPRLVWNLEVEYFPRATKVLEEKVGSLP